MWTARPMNTEATAVPRFTTSFIGREREVAELVDGLRSRRFVCLTGPGGVGKTRLTARCIPSSGPLFEHGVVWVDAVGIVASSDLRVRVADAVGVRDAKAASPETLKNALRGRRTLLVLDGCEGLDDSSRIFIEALLDSSDTLSILATTRRALHVDGGVVVLLAPLTVPPSEYELAGALVRVEDIARYEAIRLLVDRARLVRPHYELTSTNARSVVALCRRLDGLPLAIELAASWVRAMSVDQIIRRMETSPDFPRAGTSNIAPRHRTLTSLIAGTFELCTPREQALWARMSVFSESFDLTAVEAVCSGPPLDKADLLDAIASLVDQSVVVVDDNSGDSRYRLLRLTREYGSTKLQDAEEIRSRHLQHFDKLMSGYVEHWSGPGEIGLLSNLRADYGNITDAIEEGLRRSETADASARMATDLWGFWFATGRLTEGRSILDRVIGSSRLRATSVERIRALYYNSYLSLLQDDAASAHALHAAASVSGTGQGHDGLNKGLRLELDVLIGLSLEIDLVPTESLATAISIFEQADDPRASTMFMDAVSISVLFAALDGQSDYAQELGARGLAVSKRKKDIIWRAYIEYSLGVDAWVQQSFRTAHKRALFGLRTSPDQLLVTHCIELLAWCASSQANFPLAARLFGAADRRWDKAGGQFSGFTGLSRVRDECLTVVRRALKREEFAGEYRSGYRMTVEEVAEIDAETYDKTGAARHKQDASPLTSREQEVANLIAEGLSNREIARTLTISPRTAESHVDHILTKLDVSSRTQIAAWVLSRHRAERRTSYDRTGGVRE